MTNEAPRYPRRIRCSNAEFELRLMNAADADAALAFAKLLPPHDLLFLQRDIRNPKVVGAWLEQIERGTITSILAMAEGKIHGCAAIVRDALSWSPHVSEMRIVVSQSARLRQGRSRNDARHRHLESGSGPQSRAARSVRLQRGVLGILPLECADGTRRRHVGGCLKGVQDCSGCARRSATIWNTVVFMTMPK